MVAIAAVVATKPGSKFVYYTKPVGKWLRKNAVGNFARAMALGAEVRVFFLPGETYVDGSSWRIVPWALIRLVTHCSGVMSFVHVIKLRVDMFRCFVLDIHSSDQARPSVMYSHNLSPYGWP